MGTRVTQFLFNTLRSNVVYQSIVRTPAACLRVQFSYTNCFSVWVVVFVRLFCFCSFCPHTLVPSSPTRVEVVSESAFPIPSPLFPINFLVRNVLINQRDSHTSLNYYIM